MPDDTFTVERLVITLDQVTREAGPEPGTELLSVGMSVSNPPGPIDAVRHTPAMEVRDMDGLAYTADADPDLTSAIQPAETIHGVVRFTVPEEALNLELVFSPGTMEETSVTLG